jgi:putative NADH-flavin reductase
MQVLVFGANGRVGSKIVAQLLTEGHDVTAFVHGPSRLPNHDSLSVTQGDIRDSEVVSQAMEGKDVVISALGSWGTKSKDILTSGMQTIIPAMEQAGVKRIVSLTGSGAFDVTDKRPLVDRLSRLMLMVAARKVFKDGEQHIALLRASKLDWTVVRSPVMHQEISTKQYILGDKPPTPWATIPRDDVVDAMVMLAKNNEFVGQAPFIIRA